LGASWRDSGINALSVVGQFLDNLRVIDTELTFLPDCQSRDVQAIVNFAFGEAGDNQGFIETNWMRGLNQKITNLYFDYSKNQVVLNHSTQQALVIDEQSNSEVLVDYSQGLPRLTNHYIGVFEAYFKNIKTQSNNLDTALFWHQLTYNALDKTK
jgi:hypothetical protein